MAGGRRVAWSRRRTARCPAGGGLARTASQGSVWLKLNPPPAFNSIQQWVSDMPPRITLDVFEALLNCKLKAHLRLTLQEGVKSDYEAMITDLRHEVRQRAIDKIRSNYNDDTIANALPVKRSTLRAGVPSRTVNELRPERISLISEEISLFVILNSLQGRQKFPVRMRRELARKALV
jgi:hypothetical protein